MLCCRVIALIMLMLCTAAVTCSVLFPQFRLTVPSDSTETGNVTYSIYYWYNETVDKVGDTTYVSRAYSRHDTCAMRQTYFVAEAALSVAGAGLGGLAVLFTACWAPVGQKHFLGCVATLLCFLAFACCLATVGLSAYGYSNKFCGAEVSFKSANYKMVEGLILIIAAAGGFLLTCLFELISVFSSCCCKF